MGRLRWLNFLLALALGEERQRDYRENTEVVTHSKGKGREDQEIKRRGNEESKEKEEKKARGNKRREWEKSGQERKK